MNASMADTRCHQQPAESQMTTRDASADLFNLLMGFRVSQAIHVAAWPTC
jgi:hypothetical protein